MAVDQKTVRTGLNARAAGTARRRLALLCGAGLQACLAAALLAAPPKRVISLVPNVTEIVYALGAGGRVVGVGSYDTYPPEVTTLPKVGALLDPNVERILALKPDLVVIYGSQVDLKQQLTKAGIQVFPYRHGGLEGITNTIRELGARLEETAAADALVTRIEHGLDDIRRRVRGRPRPRTLLVFGHERLSLRGMYVNGGYGFMQDMLGVAGGENVFADVKTESVQATTEQIIARRPDVIVETRASAGAFSAAERDAETRTWNVLGSVPAVRNGRVIFLFDDRVVIPGPRIVEGTRELARALHPDAFK
jgi:ABC-type Fe3+-hydroxamate transport system substrate-binding protein